MQIPEDAQAEIQAYLNAVDRHLDGSAENRSEVLRDIESHIRETLASSGLESLTVQDVRSILAELDPPEWYARQEADEPFDAAAHRSPRGAMGSWALGMAVGGFAVGGLIAVGGFAVGGLIGVGGFVVAAVVLAFAGVLSLTLGIMARTDWRGVTAMVLGGLCLAGVAGFVGFLHMEAYAIEKRAVQERTKLTTSVSAPAVSEPAPPVPDQSTPEGTMALFVEAAKIKDVAKVMKFVKMSPTTRKVLNASMDMVKEQKALCKAFADEYGEEALEKYSEILKPAYSEEDMTEGIPEDVIENLDLMTQITWKIQGDEAVPASFPEELASREDFQDVDFLEDAKMGDAKMVRENGKWFLDIMEDEGDFQYMNEDDPQYQFSMRMLRAMAQAYH